jgi:hypothetical protein
MSGFFSKRQPLAIFKLLPMLSLAAESPVPDLGQRVPAFETQRQGAGRTPAAGYDGWSERPVKPCDGRTGNGVWTARDDT